MMSRDYLIECPPSPSGQFIAGFGNAQFVRHINGRYEVRGGTVADLAALRVWCAIFFPRIPI